MSGQIRFYGILFLLTTAIFFNACQKHTDPGSTGGTPNAVKEDGMIYWEAGYKVNAFDVKAQKLAWQTSIQFGFASAMAYDSGFLYTSNEYGVTALNAATGAITWQTPISSLNFINNQLSFQSMPAVVDSLLYVAGFTGNNGVICLYAIRKSNGSVKWAQPLSGVNDYPNKVPSFAISGNKIVVTGWVGGNPYRMMCLDRIGGTVIWDKSFNAVVGNVPSIKDGMVYIPMLFPPAVLAVNLNNGNQQWKTAISNASTEDRKLLLTKNNLVCISDDNSSSRTVFQFFDYSTGQIKAPLFAKFNSYIESGNNYIMSLGRYFSCYDQQTNTLKWQVDTDWGTIDDTLSNKYIYDIEETQLLKDDGNMLVYEAYANMPQTGPGAVFLNKFYFVDVSTGETSSKITLPASLYLRGIDIIYVKGGIVYYPYKSPAYQAH